MPAALQVRGQQYQQLVEALVNAFPNANQFAQMLQFRLAKDLARYAALPNTMDQIAFEVIQNANAEGWTAQLIAGARESRPDNPKLLRFAQDFGLTAATAELERKVRDDLPFLDIVKWRTRLGEIEGQVCRVETPYELGTGFLLGPDVLITNYHVMQEVIKNPAVSGQVVLRFDYKKLDDGTTVNKGIEFRLVKQNWLIDSSPHSQVDLLADPGDQTPKPDELDYALLRLDGEPGNRPIGGDKAEPTALPRRWVTPRAEPYAFPADAPVFIVQHPEAQPLKLALETKGVISENANHTRVRYRTNTEKGSSGSPVFNAEWELIALHHSGDRKIVPVYNQGIPFAAILAQLEARGKRRLLGKQD